jgi:hypothetical protein
MLVKAVTKSPKHSDWYKNRKGERQRGVCEKDSEIDSPAEPFSRVLDAPDIEMVDDIREKEQSGEDDCRDHADLVDMTIFSANEVIP